MVNALQYRPKVLLVAAVSVLAIGAPWYLVARTIGDARPVNSPLLPSSVFWGRVYFATPKELAHWLRHRGVAYSVWAKRHPPAAARIGER